MELKKIFRRIVSRLIARSARLSVIEIPVDRSAAQRELVNAVNAFQDGDTETAEAHVRASLEHALTQGDAHLFLARWLSARGALSEASNCFQLAAQYSRTPGAILSEGGQLLWRKGQVEEAMKLLREALDADPNQAEAAYAAGRIELERDPREALRYFRRCLAANPNHAGARAKLKGTSAE